MNINEQIKEELQKLQSERRIPVFGISKDYKMIDIMNSAGQWVFQHSDMDVCDHCGKKSDYMIILDDFTQGFICKECLLESLKNYDKTGWVESNEDEIMK